MYVEEKTAGEAPPVAKEKSFAQVMNEAAALIEKRGHMKGNLYGPSRFGEFSADKQPLCMFAAVHEAATGNRCLSTGSYVTHHHQLARWLRFKLYSGGICNYNNTHDQGEVVRTLRRAAVEAN